MSDHFKKPSSRFQLLSFSHLNIIRIQYFFNFLSAALVQRYIMHDYIFLTASKSVSKWLCTLRYKQSNYRCSKSQVRKEPRICNFVILFSYFIIIVILTEKGKNTYNEIFFVLKLEKIVFLKNMHICRQI